MSQLSWQRQAQSKKNESVNLGCKWSENKGRNNRIIPTFSNNYSDLALFPTSSYARVLEYNLGKISLCGQQVILGLSKLAYLLSSGWPRCHQPQDQPVINYEIPHIMMTRLHLFPTNSSFSSERIKRKLYSQFLYNFNC